MTTTHTTPTPAAITAAETAVRQAIENYSDFDSGLVPDSLLDAMVIAGLNAAYAAQFPIVPPKPAPASAP
jgi:hypothetical protein